jgi:predicted SAM-dependent methyltransferase
MTARLRPKRVARSLARRIRRVFGITPEGTARAKTEQATAPPRLGPNDPGGIRRIHVGGGANNVFPDWWNVDIRAFRGVDEVLDASGPWPWTGLDAVYGEHFIEHLPLDAALRFVQEAASHLRPGGVLRLSTPSIEWVWATHLSLAPDVSDERRITQTFAANRAFHGWGHQFLFSRPLLGQLLTGAGFEHLTWHAYGESDDPTLRGLERHRGYSVHDGWPSVWIVEGVRGANATELPEALREEAEREFLRHTRTRSAGAASLQGSVPRPGTSPNDA